MIRENKWLLTLLLIPLTELLRFLAKANPSFVEMQYSRKLFIRIMQGVSSFFGMIPISVGEILVFLYVVMLMFFILKTIGDLRNKDKRNEDLKHILKHLIIVPSILYFFFFAFYGVNFYREPIKVLDEDRIAHTSQKDLEDALSYYIDQANVIAKQMETQKVTTPTYGQIIDMAQLSYYYLPQEYRYMTGVFGPPKRLILSEIQANMGYTGMFFMFTGEPLVNGLLVSAEIPFTVTHEIAHQRGVARENEANYMAFMACIHSTEPYMNYSAYFNAIQYLGKALRQVDSEAYSELMTTVHPVVLRDLEAVVTFWDTYYKPEVGEKMDVVVEANLENHGQTDGLASYGQVVKYMLDYYLELSDQ